MQKSATVIMNVSACMWCTHISRTTIARQTGMEMYRREERERKREKSNNQHAKSFIVCKRSPHFPSIKCHECHIIQAIRKICVRSLFELHCDLYLCQKHISLAQSHSISPPPTAFCFMISHFHNFFCIGHVHIAHRTHTHAHVIRFCSSRTNENGRRQRCCCYYFMSVWWQ